VVMKFRLPTGASRGMVAEFRSALYPILGDAATQVSCSPVMAGLTKWYSGLPSILGIRRVGLTRSAPALQDSHLTGHSQLEKGDVFAYLPISHGNASGPPP
jgi:hypothetical protein